MDKLTLSALNKVKSLEELMDLLRGENIAAISEVIRSEKWSQKVIPFFVSHPNPLVRYEIAMNSNVNEEVVRGLIRDSSMIVRQAAKNNLILRNKGE